MTIFYFLFSILFSSDPLLLIIEQAFRSITKIIFLLGGVTLFLELISSLRLLDAIRTLRNPENGEVLVPGFYDQVLPLGQADIDILNNIPNPKSELEIVLGKNVDRISEVDSFYESTLTKPNLNICGFQG